MFSTKALLGLGAEPLIGLGRVKYCSEETSDWCLSAWNGGENPTEATLGFRRLWKKRKKKGNDRRVAQGRETARHPA